MLSLLLAISAALSAWLWSAPAAFSASPGLHGRVILSDGKPAVGATVFIALPGPSNLRIRNGKIAFEDLGSQKLTYVTTGADGEFNLPAQTGKYVVAAIADGGYAQLDQDDLAKSTDLTLTAWGRVRGRLMIGTKPGAAVKLQAGTLVNVHKNSPVRISICNRAQTDANGAFTMDCVQPGHFEIDQVFEQQFGPNWTAFFGQIGSAEVTAEQTTTVKLGGVGRPVEGRLVFPPKLDPSDYFVNARAFPMRPHASDVEYLLAVDAQHHFRIDNVPSGDYRVHIILQKVRGDGTEQPQEVRFTMPAVPGGVSDEPLVIPDIQLQ